MAAAAKGKTLVLQTDFPSAREELDNYDDYTDFFGGKSLAHYSKATEEGRRRQESRAKVTSVQVKAKMKTWVLKLGTTQLPEPHF